MTGTQIKTVLEQALENAFVGDMRSGAYPYAAGLRYDVKASAPMGSRLSSLEVNIRLTEDSWSPIDESTYSIVTNSFIAAGHDGYLEFKEALGVENTQLEGAQSFIDYALEVSTLVDPPSEVYSTKSFIPVSDEPETGEPASESVKFGSSLCALLMTMLVHKLC